MAAGANRAQWNGATWLQVAVLGVITALGIYAGLSLRLAAFAREREPAAGTDTTDWLGDIVAVAVRGGARPTPACWPARACW